MRDAIERTVRNVHDDRWRILVKRQGDLWDEGVRAGAVLKDAPVGDVEDDDEEAGADEIPNDGKLIPHAIVEAGEYAAGKWGRFLRAPDLYFEIMERFGPRFVPLGAIVDIRRGITSGCDAFFMPVDATKRVLAENEDPKEFRSLVGVPRAEVKAGNLRIIEDGAGTLHPIEPKFIAPVIHTLRDNRRPLINQKELDQVVLLVSGPLTKIKGTHAHGYIKYGEETVYTSKKSKAVPVPQRSCCAARDPWYDLTASVKPGFALWPLAHQYRHVIPGNPRSLIANKRMIDLIARDLSKQQRESLVAILNSTVLALFKNFYGRYTGTEGALGTDVLDVELIEVPDPRSATAEVASRLLDSFKSLCERDVGRMIEDAFMECHSYERAMELASRPIVLPEELQQSDRRALDDAVFELLGVTDAAERANLIDRLYDETARHFRAVRVTEIQKMEDRREGGGTKFAIVDHAADAWDALDLADLAPLPEWVKNNAAGECSVADIPTERPVHLATGAMFDNETVYFGKSRRAHIVAASRGQAELIARMAELGVTGEVCVPNENADAMKLLDKVNHRHAIAAKRLQELADSRSGDSDTREQVFDLLERWYVVGKLAASIARPRRSDRKTERSSM